jgi:CRP-like cAMP-binding protein
VSDAALIADIASIPLYADLDARERDELAVGLRPVRFAAGDVLIHQGAEPDGAYFILDGRVSIVTLLPGGGETLIDELGPGSTIGELALIRSARRAATVRALSDVRAVFADRRFFDAALAQMHPAAIKVLRQLVRLLSARLHLLHEKIREAVAGDARAFVPVASPPGAAPQPGTPAGVDIVPFLPRLPCFRGFDAAGIEAVRGAAEVVTAVRGTVLTAGGDIPAHGWIVVRGAVASGFIDDGRMHQIRILGPGRFCGVGALVEDRPAAVSEVVRENAILLRFRRSRFLDLYRGADRTALMLLHALTEHQADMISRANNHLTRVVGLSRLGRLLRGTDGVTVGL